MPLDSAALALEHLLALPFVRRLPLTAARAWRLQVFSALPPASRPTRSRPASPSRPSTPYVYAVAIAAVSAASDSTTACSNMGYALCGAPAGTCDARQSARSRTARAATLHAARANCPPSACGAGCSCSCVSCPSVRLSVCPRLSVCLSCMRLIHEAYPVEPRV